MSDFSTRSTKEVENISPTLLDWFYKNQRSLPFRTDPSPYHVWLSEIMLQRVLATTAGCATCKRLHASSASSTADSCPPTTMPCGPCPASGTTRRGPLPPSASVSRCLRWTEMCCGCFPACTTTTASSLTPRSSGHSRPVSWSTSPRLPRSQ